jgi:superfamily II DNA or RNA helicase
VTRPIPRAYQVRVLDAIFRTWDAGVDRVLASLATGAGKSVIFAEAGRQHLSTRRGDGPVVVLAHRRELIRQAAKHFRKAGPDLRVVEVIGNPGPKRSTRRAKTLMDWRRADVLVTSVQTLASATTRMVFPDPSLVIVDEAHHYASESYKRVLTALGCFSGTRTLAVTATPFREDHRDLSEIFPVTAASVDIAWLIRHCDDGHGGERKCAPGEGYLVPPVLRHLLVDGLDLSQVPTSRRSGAVDFREAELAEAMAAAGAFDMIAEAVRTDPALRGRKGAIFAPTVASSRYLAQTLTAAGVPCHHLDGETPTEQREDIMADFAAGRVMWLSNVNIIGEGVDIPSIDAVVLARPSQSRIFIRQAIGRALRPDELAGKRDAVVFDCVGATDGHSLNPVDALTDADVLPRQGDESLTALLDRSDRARRGLVDRIAAMVADARGIQDRGEHSFEQLRITAEHMQSQLPGLVTIAARAVPELHALLDATTRVVDVGLVVGPRFSLDGLAEILELSAWLVDDARRHLSAIEALKVAARGALVAVREEPAGEVARAMVTGHLGTVSGSLFGQEDERYTPSAPKSVGGLQTGRGERKARPVHPARQGWVLRTDEGHLYAPVHNTGRTVIALSIAVALPDGRWLPVVWRTSTGQIDELTTSPLTDEGDAYRRIVELAADASGNVNLIDPSAAWRRKSCPAGHPMRRTARNADPSMELPDEAQAGYVSDVITHGIWARGTVVKVAEFVRAQVSAGIAQ